MYLDTMAANVMCFILVSLREFQYDQPAHRQTVAAISSAVEAHTHPGRDHKGMGTSDTLSYRQQNDRGNSSSKEHLDLPAPGKDHLFKP